MIDRGKRSKTLSKVKPVENINKNLQSFREHLQHLLFMLKVKNSINPRIFNQVFSLIDHLYPTRFSDNSFKICDFNLKLTRFAIGFRGPTTWNKFLTQSEKRYTSIDEFKNKMKRKILNFSNEFLFF